MSVAFLYSRKFLIALLIALPILAFGWSALHSDFVSLDDTLLITGNDTVRVASARSVIKAFTSYDPELYVPLTLVSYQIENAVFGLNPVVFHLTNLLLHVGSVLLLFFLARMLLGRELPAFAVAALFAIHPLNTEAVLWAAARKDLLSTFFFLLALFLYERAIRMRQGQLLLWSLAAFFFALLSKATVVTLPVILILFDWLAGRRIDKKNLLSKWPWFLLSVIFGIVALFGKTKNLGSISLFDELLIGGKSVLFYWEKLLWPAHLGVAYPQEAAVALSHPEFFVPIVIIAALIGLGLLFRKSRYPLFGIAFFLITVSPNFLNVWKNGMLFFASDRYAYIASIGIFLIIGWLLTWIKELTAVLITGVLCVILVPVSFAQSRSWHSSETLYRHALTVAPRSGMILNNLGETLVRQGKEDEGLSYYMKAAEQNSKSVTTLTNIGNIYKQRGDLKNAEKYYRDAVAAAPKDPFPEQLTGFYLLGELLIDEGKTDDGFAVLKQATVLGAKYAEPSFNYGLMLEKQNRKPEAIFAFKEAVGKGTEYLIARYHLAALLAEKGDLDEAIAQLEYIVERNPNYEKAQEHLAGIRTLLGK